jgi:hypothetical protein
MAWGLLIMSTVNILETGARPDGETSNTQAIQRAINECHGAGGGRVVIPAGGVFVTGTLALKTGVELHLENGACLQASHREEDYQQTAIAGEYGGSVGGFLLYADGAENLSLTGSGVIDGQAQAFLDGWWTEDGPYIRKPRAFRPRLIGLFGCRGIRIRDVTIRDAPQWTCHLTGCEDVVISGITILNGLDVPNCDGIDPDHCRNVRISDCHIEAGDDGIVIKATREFRHFGPCENITVTGCSIVSTSAGIKIGTESVSDIRNIVVTGCVIRRSHRGLAIQLRDEGNVEEVSFSDCLIETRQFHPKWWGNAEAVYITAIPRHPDRVVGTVRGISCRGIRFTGENGVFLAGTEESPLEDILLDSVSGRIVKTSRFPVDFHDMRPSQSEEHGGLDRGKLSGITARHVDGLVIRNCAVSFPVKGLGHWSHALSAEKVRALTLSGFRGESPQGEEGEAIRLREVSVTP